jgi:predicted nucleic acid-binding protein
VILIDANIFMYAAGHPHANKEPSVAFLKRVALDKVKACASGEVLQEILHRYRSINRWTDGKLVYRQARSIVQHVQQIDVEVLDRAYQLMEAHSHLTARDAVHAATCMINGFKGICSYDTDFDVIPGFRRFVPDECL